MTPHPNAMAPHTILLMADCARLMDNPDTESVRRLLVREGAATKRAGRWVTTPARLVACFPTAFQRVKSA